MLPAATIGSMSVLSHLSGGGLSAVLVGEVFVSLTGLAFINGKVGYRWFDVALLVLPVYGFIYLARVIWRAAHLPNDYWTPATGVSEIYRAATFIEFVGMGVPRRVASLSALALFPLDDSLLPSVGYSRKLDALVLDTARKIRDTGGQPLESVAVTAVQKYLDLAQEFAEPYYVARFGAAIDECRAVARDMPSRASEAGESTNELAEEWAGQFEIDDPMRRNA